MRYLLDTNVISEVRRPQPDRNVLAWLDQVEEERLYLSVVSIGELARGIALLPDGRRKADLANWLDADLQFRFGARLLTIDSTVAMIWGRLMADAKQCGNNVGVMDGWIAAVVVRYELAVATRNVRDFKSLGVQLFDPWDWRK